MTETHQGSCLCGEINFEITGNFQSFYLCHCTHCRKDTGSAHAANLFSGTAKIKWLSGEKTKRTFTLPGTQHCKSFCTQCGSALPYYLEGLKLLVVPAGSLDSDIPLKPDSHLYWASKANWDDALHTLPRFEKRPVKK